MKQIAVALLATLAGLTTCSAQRIWTVDLVTSRPADFRDIPPAIAAASPGDTILVRLTSALDFYSPFVLTKGVNIVPPHNGLIQVKGAIVISNIPANERCNLSNIMGYPLTVKDCVGPVTIHGGYFPSVGGARAMLVQNCKLVTMWGTGNAPMTVEGSTVVFIDSGLWYPYVGSAIVPLTLTNAKMTFVNSSLRGDPGQLDLINCTRIKFPFHAVNASNSDLILTGASSFCGGGTQSGGLYCNNLNLTAPAIVSTGAGVRVYAEPGVYIGAIQGPYTKTTISLPQMSANYGAPGFPVTTYLRSSRPNALAALYASLPTVPYGSPFGELYLDSTFCVLMDVGFTDAAGKRDFTFTLSPTAPLGWPLLFQSALLVGSTVEVSAPMVVPTS